LLYLFITIGSIVNTFPYFIIPEI